ncbi:hypothetical protein Ahy_A07g031118 isoform B [Arachis hypogaea]|uniref:Uncharacterized protein n=1 Tax=Arachis hypogaea TaxID=3818 RepID=A0A445C306_ARAHY|nr:hypothetical protein Ahy_A07g031118 isoform B [Arachis hypogaea]
MQRFCRSAAAVRAVRVLLPPVSVLPGFSRTWSSSPPCRRRLAGRRPCLHRRFSVIRFYLLLFCNGSHRGGGNVIAGVRVAAVDEMATATVVDHAMAVVVAVGAVEFVVIFNAVVMDTEEEAAEESKSLEEASLPGVELLMQKIHNLIVVAGILFAIPQKVLISVPLIFNLHPMYKPNEIVKKKKIISPQKQGGEETMMAILNVIIEREGRNWRKKVVVQVHIPPYKAFSGMVVLLMVLGSVVPQIR